MQQFMEPADTLDHKTADQARAITSLGEELEAINYYNQRMAVAPDEELRKILVHNRDEEIEHAAMLIEWLRRNMDKWDEELRTYLFTTASIVDVEEAAVEGTADSPSSEGSLGIGSLK